MKWRMPEDSEWRAVRSKEVPEEGAEHGRAADDTTEGRVTIAQAPGSF